jgi:C_GCAxxG_C_C family probable redox protein
MKEQGMEKQQAAVELFNNGCNCSQAVLAIYGQEYGLSQENALRLAAGFGGGLGGTGGICGALTGACMALGLAFGPSVPGDKTGKAEMYRKIRILGEEFKKRAGATMCRDLLGFNLSTPEGQLAAKQPRAFDKCDEFVRIAAEILDGMLK